MRKGRHRRHEIARQLKRGTPVRSESSPAPVEPCEECQRSPHADWCMAEAELEEVEVGQ
jgi:hypothetical protein